METRELSKSLINELKGMVDAISASNPSEKKITKKLWELYKENAGSLSYSYHVCMSVAAYLIVLRSLRVKYTIA